MRNVASAIILTAGLFLCLGSGAASADESAKPIQLALVNPLQIFNEETSIHGLRINVIYGVNKDMHGLDIGIANHTTGTVKGLQWGFVGLADGNFHGWQNNMIVNVTDEIFQGFQSGFYNEAGSGEGFQYGFVNRATSFEGFQLGILNMTDTLKGLQIGILNIRFKGESHRYLPLVNWRF
jgi:hypothetical protein